MYCYKCGQAIVNDDDAAFCIKCGASLQPVYEMKRAADAYTAAQANASDAPQSAASQTNTPQASAPQQAAPQQVTPQQVTSQQVAPQQVAPQQVTPQQVAPQQVTSQQVTPQQVAPQQVASRRIAPSKTNSRKLLVGAIFVGAIAIFAIIVAIIIPRLGRIDITHGGEKEWICNNDYDWVFDYNWAEIDEDWKGFDKNASLKLGFDFLTNSSNLGESLNDSICRDYIEERLYPVRYNADTYFEFCPQSSVKKAHKAWKEYLKDHKDLKKMYIVIDGEKVFPYADDNFDKTVIMNEFTAYRDVYDDYGLFGNDDTAKRFCISMYMTESLSQLSGRLRALDFDAFADKIDEACQTAQEERTSISGCHYFYPEDDEYYCNAILFMMDYLSGTVYEGADGKITVSQDPEGAYLFGYQINYNPEE